MSLSYQVNNELMIIDDPDDVFYINRLTSLCDKRVSHRLYGDVFFFDGHKIPGLMYLNYAIFNDYLWLKGRGMQDLGDLIIENMKGRLK